MTLDHLYIRYFNTEVLVGSADEALDFLSTIPDITVDEAMTSDIRGYYASKMPYPKRFKVNARCYFIVIKTSAKTLDEFKNHNKPLKPVPAPVVPSVPAAPARNVTPQKERVESFGTYRPGWYEATMVFKRVISNPVTNKCSYQDTEFRARLKATSVQDCYNRMKAHLQNRRDVDPRSQFPSIKGKNFAYQYQGMN